MADDQQSSPDLQKLRRFALAIALVLITYSVVAEVTVKPNITQFGIIEIRVTRPEWLGIGLALTSFISALRFGYYGFLMNASPARKRKEVREKLQRILVSDR